MKTKKPPGFAAFDSLVKDLIQVPKREIDAQANRYEARKQKRLAKRTGKPKQK